MNNEVERFLVINDIPFKYANRVLRIYLKDEKSRNTKEFVLYLTTEKYELGITTSSQITMKEHKILTTLFDLLCWE